ncbi:M48 family metalloprotease [Qipengyuania sp. NPDC077563]|uniref:M48 family metalloprotease n=1 Tax=Qipengyuania sp. NPDC077563 TaxID=3364497 RepID=UPI0038504C84
MAKGVPTGLYGWIRSNDGRSLGLFLAFMLAVQLIAIPILFLPLVIFDQLHAPFLNTVGYLVRYAPIVLAISVVWFAVKYWWHIETVKKAVGFHFIDNRDEPYLCAVIEPLITTWGLPVPFVGVIESEARNAFACGIGRKKAVVVVTRDLIDSLTREELECVLAHELSHIKNNDIRLMAAANIFMSALTDMHRSNPMQVTPVHGLMALAVPVMLPLALLGSFIGVVALRAGQMSRLMISSRREYIADAEAVSLTKNPGAMASALVKVEHAYRVEGARNEDDAMMIASDTDGDNATHPTVAQRVAALARTTGSMVFNSHSSPRSEEFASNPSLSQAQATSLLRDLPPMRALPRIRKGSKTNWIGLDRLAQISAVVTTLGLVGLHWSEIDQPQTMLAKFDVRPISLAVGRPLACDLGTLSKERCDAERDGTYAPFDGQKNTLAGWLAAERKRRQTEGYLTTDVSLGTMNASVEYRREWMGVSGRMKGVMASFSSQEGNDFKYADGTFRSGIPDEMKIAELEQVGCYNGYSTPYSDPAGEFALYGDRRLGYDITSFENRIAMDSIARGTPGSEDEAEWLVEYIENRELNLAYGFSNWGRRGFEMLKAAYDNPSHAAMLDRLRQRWDEPAFRYRFDKVGKARVSALLKNSNEYVPCFVLRRLDKFR